MTGHLPAPDPSDGGGLQRAGTVAAPGQSAFDARGAVRPTGARRSEAPKRTYEVTLYRATAGDSAWTVARRFGVSTMTIWWANRIEAWERLRVGQLLRVLPISGIEHLVRDGDTLDSIARAYQADADAIAETNGLVGGVVLLGQWIIVPDGRGGRYLALDDIRRSSSIPRLQPGQADRAPVDHLAVAGPLLAPRPAQNTGIKDSGGVAWPADPDWTAGPGLPVSTPRRPDRPHAPLDDVGGESPRGREPRRPDRPHAPLDDAGGESPRGRERPHRPDEDEPSIVIPPDAPVPGGHGRRDVDWPEGGPPAGPAQGQILTIDDDRLTITEAAVRRRRSLLWPVHGGGRLTQQFYRGEHHGIDIADLRGTPLLAAESARVVFAGWRDDRGGRSIYLKHGPSFFTGYAHLWRLAVEAGDWVERGQVIGYMGSTGYSTGSHVHFTVTDGPLPNFQPHTVDPLTYLRRP
jgi:murein DD-endopeptidase MepM/ murein hydrolase activator NlpD